MDWEKTKQSVNYCEHRSNLLTLVFPLCPQCPPWLKTVLLDGSPAARKCREMFESVGTLDPAVAGPASGTGLSNCLSALFLRQKVLYYICVYFAKRRDAVEK